MSAVEIIEAVAAGLGGLEAVLAVVGAKNGVCQKIVLVLKAVLGLEKQVEAVVASPSPEAVVAAVVADIPVVEAVVKSVEQK